VSLLVLSVCSVPSFLRCSFSYLVNQVLHGLTSLPSASTVSLVVDLLQALLRGT